ncbi:hypothetical protein [Rhodoferax sp.]|uniref:antitoxin PaaA2 family protein n=1 Tax=Rhodoferax sp. TaxID=50421 RepID=UPI00275A1E7A|nr:hypothetical protein [Rhodoferax sp.]
MHSMTLEQLRVASNSGGVSGVTLKGQGGAFLVQIDTRSGSGAVLSKARSSEPRRFGNPIAALSLLRDLGITVGQFDASDWNPDEKVVNSRDDARAQVLREAHEAGAYVKWLASEIQESIDDPRPSVPHDEVMSRMDARIARHKTAGGKRA